MKLKNLLFSLIIALFTNTFVYAQTVTDNIGGVIPSNGVYTVFNLPVSGISPSLMDGTYGLKELCINITHPNVTEVNVQLVSPSGQKIEIVKNNPAGGSNYDSTFFDGSATTSINSGSAPFTGHYRPTGYIGKLNNSTNANGTWKLQVKVWSALGTPATLTSWSLTFGATPLTPVNLTSSNLPLVIINTGGQTIIDESKKIMDISIIYNGLGVRNNITDPPNNYNGKAGIEYRGSSSAQFQKKSISLETIDNAGLDLDVSLLGMPLEHDWILYASYIDKTLIRNALTYDLAASMGDYASRNKFVEVIIDGEYQGVYALEEKIKRGKNRVDISKLTNLDNAGDDLTGGYIIRIDKTDGTDGGWKSNIGPASGSTDTVFFQYYYPKDTTITLPQQTYIQNYIDSFEQVIMSPDFANPITGYNKYIDASTFVDYFIISELSKNIDAYKVSTYLYKDKDSKGGKLKIGPVWDFDLAWSNANYGNASDPTGWKYTQTAVVYENPRWWERLMQDPDFLNKIKCRWEQLKVDAIITPATLYSKIDSLSTYLSEAQQRNFIQWPMLDANVWTNPAPVPNTYAGHLADLKSWITSRYNWLNGVMPGSAANCLLSNESASLKEDELVVYPNPFKDQTAFKFYLSESADVTLKVYDVLGKEVSNILNKNKQMGEQEMILNGEKLNSGVYFYHLMIGNRTTSGKIIIQK